MSKYFLPIIVLLAFVPNADAVSFSYDVGLGGDVWFEDLIDDPPSGFTGQLGLGVHFDFRWSLKLDYSFHYGKDDAGNIEQEIRSHFFDADFRYFYREDSILRLYHGLGITVGYFDGKSKGWNTVKTDDGIGFGFKYILGMELGSRKYMEFIELGYRTCLTEPFDDKSASDFNNLAIIIGFRIKR